MHYVWVLVLTNSMSLVLLLVLLCALYSESKCGIEHAGETRGGTFVLTRFAKVVAAKGQDHTNYHCVVTEIQVAQIADEI